MMTVFEIINIVTPFIVPVIAGIVAWVAGRRKTKAEIAASEAVAAATELANVERAISIYRKMAEDLSGKIVELQQQLKTMHDQNNQLLSENTGLRLKLDRMERMLNDLQNKE